MEALDRVTTQPARARGPATRRERNTGGAVAAESGTIES